MLTVYLHDELRRLRFRLIGDLRGPGAEEFEQSWRTARSTLDGRSVVVDLSDVTTVGGDGLQLLRRLSAEGALFISSTAFSDSVARETSGRSPVVSPATRPSPWLRLLCWLARRRRCAESFLAHGLPCRQNLPKIW